jgi:hypothetical protein
MTRTVLDRALAAGDSGRVSGERRERPDPEVPEKACRRTFTAQYKLDTDPGLQVFSTSTLQHVATWYSGYGTPRSVSVAANGLVAAGRLCPHRGHRGPDPNRDGLHSVHTAQPAVGGA